MLECLDLQLSGRDRRKEDNICSWEDPGDMLVWRNKQGTGGVLSEVPELG